MGFKILGKISNVTLIAAGREIRELARLERIYGKARGRKMKGFAKVELDDGTIVPVELHWYEAHGIGRKETKIKLFF